MKTLFIYNDYEKIQFFIIEGDYSKFNGIMINSIYRHEFEEECLNFMYDSENGNVKHEMSDDVSLIKNKQWDEVALITFLS